MIRQYGAYAIAAQRRAQHGREQRWRFADLIAEGFTISAAARALGLSQQRGSQFMADLRAEMGSRAR